jgi:hypothetical protein
MLSIRSTTALVAITASALLTLAACAPANESTASTRKPSASPTPTASTTPTSTPKKFTVPSDCGAGILPQARLDAFAAQGLILLGGPGGKFGTDYLLDPTPEENAGGITCIWGMDASNQSRFTVSVAPLTAINRSSIVDSLLSQGLNPGTDGSANTFSQQGDAEREPAILNVLRHDSWISVISTIGGPAEAEDAKKIADQVASVVYTPL